MKVRIQISHIRSSYAPKRADIDGARGLIFLLLCDLLSFKIFLWSKLLGYATYYTVSLIRAVSSVVCESGGLGATLWSPPSICIEMYVIKCDGTSRLPFGD